MRFTDEELDIIEIALDAYKSDYEGTPAYGRRASEVEALMARFSWRGV